MKRRVRKNTGEALEEGGHEKRKQTYKNSKRGFMVCTRAILIYRSTVTFKGGDGEKVGTRESDLHNRRGCKKKQGSRRKSDTKRELRENKGPTSLDSSVHRN